MHAVIIGVSDRSILWRHSHIPEKEYISFVDEYAQFCASHFENVIITPDDGVYTDVADRFASITGKKPIAYYPEKDAYYGIDHIRPNFPKYQMRPIGGDWYTLNAELTKQARVVITLGFSPGVMIEGSFIKYHQKYAIKHDPSLANIHWFIDERCIESRLPRCFEEQIRNIVYYSSLAELGTIISGHRELLEPR